MRNFIMAAASQFVIACLLVDLPFSSALASGRQPASASSDDSALTEARLAKLERVLLHLNAGEEDLGVIAEAYESDALFIDPLFPEGLQGHQALLRYHRALNGMTERFEVSIKDTMVHGNSILIFWTAEAELSLKLALGQALKRVGLPDLGHTSMAKWLKLGAVRSEGVSRFDFTDGSELIAKHHDYYDGLTQLQGLPVIGSLLNLITEQMRRSLSGPSEQP